MRKIEKIRTVGDAHDENQLRKNRRLDHVEAQAKGRAARAMANFLKTPAGREVLQDRSLRWCPPQYKGGAAEWRLNNAEAR